MTIRTAFTAMFGLDYPIVSAPMGGISGGRLAAAVFNLDGERARFQQAGRDGDYDVRMVWASEAADLILSVEGAGDLTRGIGAEAERLLRAAGALCISA
jgi:hypothetical protein